jgi:hypothetical protein
MTVPNAPTGVVATVANGLITVNWDAVSANPAITSYTVTPSVVGLPPSTPPPTVTVIGNPPASSVTLSGLDPANYAFTVSATNDDGTGPESALTADVYSGPKPHGYCGECYYFDTQTPTAQPTGASGLCRYSVPVVIATRPANQISVWPTVQTSDWCGTYMPAT